SAGQALHHEATRSAFRSNSEEDLFSTKFSLNPGCFYQASSQGLCQHQPEEEEGSILL
ncbi:hypothetical protein LEMLEM_LOCUS8865, partial [Lemmus lemmus]